MILHLMSLTKEKKLCSGFAADNRKELILLSRFVYLIERMTLYKYTSLHGHTHTPTPTPALCHIIVSIFREGKCSK